MEIWYKIGQTFTLVATHHAVTVTSGEHVENL